MKSQETRPSEHITNGVCHKKVPCIRTCCLSRVFTQQARQMVSIELAGGGNRNAECFPGIVATTLVIMLLHAPVCSSNCKRLLAMWLAGVRRAWLFAFASLASHRLATANTTASSSSFSTCNITHICTNKYRINQSKEGTWVYWNCGGGSEGTFVCQVRTLLRGYLGVACTPTLLDLPEFLHKCVHETGRLGVLVGCEWVW